MTSDDLPAVLQLTPEHRSVPSQFPAEPQACARWLEQLPKTHLGQYTRALYQAVTDLNQVALPPAVRLPLLEQFRPAIRFACAGLERRYLGQPLVLPPQAATVVRLAQTLTGELAQGYIKVALQTLPAGTGNTLALALQRAVVESSRNLLRDAQLYQSAQPRCWRALHELGALARRHAVQQIEVTDSLDAACSVEAAYQRALLLGCASTGQLRQEQLAQLFAHLAAWTSYVRFGDSAGALWLIDCRSDRGPVYREQVMRHDGAAATDCLGLDTDDLGQYLADLIGPGAKDEPPAGLDRLPGEALQRLAEAWRRPAQRSFRRGQATGTVEASLGLAATHHFASDAVDFKLLVDPRGHDRLAPAGGNPFLDSAPRATGGTRGRDVWDSVYRGQPPPQAGIDMVDARVRSHYERTAPAGVRYMRHTLTMVDISAGGCRLRLNSDTPATKPGEIIGIRDAGHKNWQVGIIRWARILQTGPHLGVELLSPEATAYGARVLAKTGTPGDYLRVLRLPGLAATGGLPTLVTPRLPFRVGHKVELALGDQRTRVQLTRCLRSTTAVSQFEFNPLSVVSEPGPKAATTAGSDFDVLWDTL